MQWVERASIGYLSQVARDGQRPFRYRTRVAELLGRPGGEGRLSRPFPLTLPFGLLYRRAHPYPDTPLDVHLGHMPGTAAFTRTDTLADATSIAPVAHAKISSATVSEAVEHLPGPSRAVVSPSAALPQPGGAVPRWSEARVAESDGGSAVNPVVAEFDTRVVGPVVSGRGVELGDSRVSVGKVAGRRSGAGRSEVVPGGDVPGLKAHGGEPVERPEVVDRPAGEPLAPMVSPSAALPQPGGAVPRWSEARVAESDGGSAVNPAVAEFDTRVVGPVVHSRGVELGDSRVSRAGKMTGMRPGGGRSGMAPLDDVASPHAPGAQPAEQSGVVDRPAIEPLASALVAPVASPQSDRDVPRSGRERSSDERSGIRLAGSDYPASAAVPAPAQPAAQPSIAAHWPPPIGSTGSEKPSAPRSDPGRAERPRSHVSEGARRLPFPPEPRLISRHQTDAADTWYPPADHRQVSRRPAPTEPVPAVGSPRSIPPMSASPLPPPRPARFVHVRSESRSPSAVLARLHIGRLGLRGLR